MAVAIVTDTCHYLPRDLVAEQGIHEVSLYVRQGDQVRRESELSDYDAYYRWLAGNGRNPEFIGVKPAHRVEGHEPLETDVAPQAQPAALN